LTHIRNIRTHFRRLVGKQVNMKTLVSAVLVAVTLLLAALFTHAAAQAETFVTGTLGAKVDGMELRLHSSYQTVPANAADGVTDPRQRAILERVAGTDQHTATFMAREAMTMGGMVLVEAKLYVAIGTRADGSEANGAHGVDVRFSLALDTLDLATLDDVEVYYYPRGWSTSDFYALTDGGITLTTFEVVDDTTLSIAGAVTGTLSHQTSFDVQHNLDDTLQFEAVFDIARVIGSSTAFDMLTAE